MAIKARESEAKALTPADMWQPGLNAIYNKIKAFILGPLLRGEMHPSDVDEIFSKGGRSSGKSTATAFWIWLALENDPKKNAVIVRKVAAHLRKTVWKQMMKVRRQLGFTHWKANATQMVFTNTETGQQIYFVGLDDEEALRSITVETGYISIVWYEEAKQFANYEEIMQSRASILRGGVEVGEPPDSDAEFMTFITYNPPKSGNHWINREARKPKEGRFVHSSTYLTMPPAWVGKNILAEAERLKETNPKQYAYMYLGESVGVEQQFFTNLEFREIPDDEIARMKWFDYGIDWGEIDPNVWMQGYLEDGVLYIIKGLWQKGKQKGKIYKFADMVAEEMKGHEGDVIYADCQVKTFAEILNDRGLNVHDGTPKHGANGRVYGGRFLQGLRKIVINTRPGWVPQEIQDEFANFEHAEDPGGGFKDEPQKGDDHGFDCARYMLNKWIAKGDINNFVDEEKMDELMSALGDDDDDMTTGFEDDDDFDMDYDM